MSDAPVNHEGHLQDREISHRPHTFDVVVQLQLLLADQCVRRLLHCEILDWDDLHLEIIQCPRRLVPEEQRDVTLDNGDLVFAADLWMKAFSNRTPLLFETVSPLAHCFKFDLRAGSTSTLEVIPTGGGT